MQFVDVPQGKSFRYRNQEFVRSAVSDNSGWYIDRNGDVHSTDFSDDCKVTFIGRDVAVSLDYHSRNDSHPRQAKYQAQDHQSTLTYGVAAIVLALVCAAMLAYLMKPSSRHLNTPITFEEAESQQLGSVNIECSTE